MYHGKFVSVILATYREKNSIRKVIEDFFKTGFVDEVIVVNNNSEEGTLEEVKKTKARIITENKQGYGIAYQTGIKNAKGDYVILCEPDGTYVPEDIEKFLVYAKKDFEVVFGSRTAGSAPFSNSPMNFWRKYPNVLEAKTIELLFNSNSLTDIGCTCKLLTRKAINKLSKLWKVKNSLFATELILLTVTQGLKFAEIPITFKKRVGRSSLTGKWHELALWGIRIQFYIIKFFIRNTISNL
ncbi:MAG: glycosyltransferase family 2 protein [bacterium]|nr:glycosyltransferase family 2 protein [bacterium]